MLTFTRRPSDNAPALLGDAPAGMDSYAVATSVDNFVQAQGQADALPASCVIKLPAFSTFLSQYPVGDQRNYVAAQLVSLSPPCASDVTQALNNLMAPAPSVTPANNNVGWWVLGAVLVAGAITATVLVVRKRRKSC